MTGHPGPAQLFGPLFAAVQERGIFADSKTFADAVPRAAPEAILAAWRAAAPLDDGALREFIAQHFNLPPERDEYRPDGRPIAQHIAGLWPILTRTAAGAPGASELALPRPFVVPGGRFRELYYWDSFFTMLGLARSGREDLIEDMIADFGSLLDRFGHIPNGTRTYYLSRSHPPFFHLMAGLSTDGSESARRRRLGWMRREHDFWMAGAGGLAPGAQARRTVRLADGSLLNRYWDDSDAPRDESWREDVTLAGATSRQAGELWRDIRAAAESGWDFSSRWFQDGVSLATIRTTRFVPIDLNCLLHGLESRIAREAAALGDPVTARIFSGFADDRQKAINAHLWNDAEGHYGDLSLDTGQVGAKLNAAAAFALFAGIADATRAERSAEALTRLLRPGGLVTTLSETGEQWDAPNGWAPLQWIAVTGLRRYGFCGLAETIAERWLTMVDERYRATGQLFEKYDVERRETGGGGEYRTETGFGWTNGVALDLLAARGELQERKAS
ncbi:alpha,alpha-trehalase TreA [Sphingomonas canadensis]|uniref:Alpha,alpha-trehalase TreA n=1 Tax=Sphingomonas canadensis TaxID=1219257 RepID=A0ABW3H4N1_9SPHN|nr:alpha,alpha-trehalase TreA [Sphingomonas canadensis]MCW3834790.1 alpha,alpha-trehalase TreA [Sphingomonas canadensis]